MENSLIHSFGEQPLETIRKFLGNSNEEILIVSPYIRTPAFIELQLPKNLKITVITTLRVRDLWSGSSDIELYPYLNSKSISMFVNNNIHLKAYVRDWKSCIFGSSNLSGRGLGIGDQYNYELNGIVEKLGFETVIYLKRILSNSELMTDSIYKAALEKMELMPPKIKIDEIDIPSIRSNKEYLISSLPMSKSIETLYELGSKNFETDDQEERNCAIHDSVLFDLNFDQDFAEFKTELSEKFFSSEFVRALLKFIDDGEDRYFGKVKGWIKRNCSNVPVPSMRDLTGNIQVLYKWIVELSDGKYLVDVPKNHSERIYRTR